jgi:fucose 4-O-acetylase-like acetyltransferase
MLHVYFFTTGIYTDKCEKAQWVAYGFDMAGLLSPLFDWTWLFCLISLCWIARSIFRWAVLIGWWLGLYHPLVGLITIHPRVLKTAQIGVGFPWFLVGVYCKVAKLFVFCAGNGPTWHLERARAPRAQSGPLGVQVIVAQKLMVFHGSTRWKPRGNIPHPVDFRTYPLVI